MTVPDDAIWLTFKRYLDCARQKVRVILGIPGSCYLCAEY
jgi:hypothetical protein